MPLIRSSIRIVDTSLGKVTYRRKIFSGNVYVRLWQGTSFGKDDKLTKSVIRSKLGNMCRVRADVPMAVTSDSKPIGISSPEENVIRFETEAGGIYLLEPKNN
jgi:hypothetical protein